jgi:hypothetical protein
MFYLLRKSINAKNSLEHSNTKNLLLDVGQGLDARTRKTLYVLSAKLAKSRTHPIVTRCGCESMTSLIRNYCNDKWCDCWSKALVLGEYNRDFVACWCSTRDHRHGVPARRLHLIASRVPVHPE